MAGRLTTVVRIGSAAPVAYDEKVMGGPNPLYGGRNTPTRASRTPNKLARELTNALLNEAISKQERNFERELKVMITAIKYAADVESRKLIDFIARHMVGVRGAEHGVDFKNTYFQNGMKTWTGRMKPSTPLQGQVEWTALSRSWMDRKRNDQFFVHTGQLKQEILGMRASYPAALGGIQVRVQQMSDRTRKMRSNRYQKNEVDRRRVVLASLEIVIFPRADATRFPGLATGKWDTVDRRATLEASGIFSEMASRKLRGLSKRNGRDHFNPTRFRPMFGPATQFWMMHRIPVAIADAIRRGTKLRDRNRG